MTLNEIHNLAENIAYGLDENGKLHTDGDVESITQIVKSEIVEWLTVNAQAEADHRTISREVVR